MRTLERKKAIAQVQSTLAIKGISSLLWLNAESISCYDPSVTHRGKKHLTAIKHLNELHALTGSDCKLVPHP
jgi:hypothetical protein